MFINIPLRDYKCGIFQNVCESLGIKGKARMGLPSQLWEDTIHAERATHSSAPLRPQGQETRPLLLGLVTLLPLSSISLTKYIGDLEKVCICFSFHLSVTIC